MKIKLNIFTNCTEIIETKKTILDSFNSFVDNFEYIEPTIYLDPNPLNKTNTTGDYILYLRKNFPTSKIIISSSFSDAYIKCVKESEEIDFMFMLEHDWVFNNNINHDLKTICKEMDYGKIHHIRFNKYSNAKNDIGTPSSNCEKEIKGKTITYCQTNFASNNPHIINVKEYKKDILKYLKIENGSGGIEHNLEYIEGSNFAVYGDINLNATIKHLNGRCFY